MRMKTISNMKAACGGFTLIEVMVALLIFGLGVLGVTKITGNGVARIVDNNARAVALNVASQQLEPLYIAASGGNTAFQAALAALAGGGINVSGNGGRDSYTVSVVEARDSSAAPVDLLTSTTPATWQPPLKVAVSVSYTGRNGTISVNAPFVFVTTQP